ncbi:MAG: hypothetical protein KA978_16705 [Deltaproteobacteria bacterium]|nr:hypothetical protein [Deltaproteobacteria bacterium]MBP6832429.1 hypothetical protein [Deltaproteobacteria bacterium]
MNATTTRQPRRRRRHHASRGAAYAETVVMLPFFVAVFSCMMFVHKAWSTKLYTMQQNRHCVVSYAFEACQRPLPGCSQVRVGADTAAGAGERPGALNSLQSMLGGAGSALLGGFFGQTASGRLTRPVNRPTLLGGGSLNALAGNSMACNTVRTTPADVARQLFCTVIPVCR